MPGTVSVGCKLPHGLVLRVYKMEAVAEPMMGGGFREVQRAVQVPGEAKINGFARYKGQDLDYEIRGGFALTHGVDADLWAAWLAQNKENEYVKKGLIFAQAKAESASAQARDHAAERSGFEPIDPDRLPAEFSKPGMVKIEKYKAS